MNIQNEITKLFQTRDKAVLEKDYQQFASTQLQDLPNYSMSGYISCGQLKTEVLYVVEDGELKKVAFVKEDYGIHSVFLIYYLVNTVEGWKIYNIASSLS